MRKCLKRIWDISRSSRKQRRHWESNWGKVYNNLNNIWNKTKVNFIFCGFIISLGAHWDDWVRIKRFTNNLSIKARELKFRIANEDNIDIEDEENSKFKFEEGILFEFKKKNLDYFNVFVNLHSLAYTTLYTDWHMLEDVLNLLLFYMFKSCKREILLHTFELKKGIDSMPQYKIALQKHIPDLQLDMDDYMMIWLEANWLANPTIKILQIVNLINIYIKMYDGLWIYDWQGNIENSEWLPEITGLVKNLQPVIIIAIPYKPGKVLAYRDWAQDSLDEDSKSSDIKPFQSNENFNVFH